MRDRGTLDREEISRAFLDAFENPMVAARGGRPRAEDGGRRILKMLEAKEPHAHSFPFSRVDQVGFSTAIRRGEENVIRGAWTC